MKELLYKFVEWTKLKVRIHVSEREIYFREGEIWWVSLGANIGYEQDGKNSNFERPVLIVRKLSRHILWVVPLSTKLKPHSYYYQYTYNGSSYSAILTQLRTISSKRLLRKIGLFPKEDFESVRKELKKMI